MGTTTCHRQDSYGRNETTGKRAPFLVGEYIDLQVQKAIAVEDGDKMGSFFF